MFWAPSLLVLLVLGRMGTAVTPKGYQRGVFIPFSGEPSSLPPPWLPFANTSSGQYDDIKDKFSKYKPHLTQAGSEQYAKQLLRVLSLFGHEGRTVRPIPSGAWGPHISNLTVAGGSFHDVGLLYDDLFAALVSPEPSFYWYLHLLVVRDALFEHWMAIHAFTHALVL